MTSCTPFTYFLYTPLLAASMAVGAGLLLWLFLVDCRIYRRPFFPLLFLFCVSYFVTILLNRNSGFFSNCGQLVYTAFYFFLFFCLFSSLSSTARLATFRLLFRMVFVFSVSIALISVGMMLENYSAEVPYRGTVVKIGFYQRNTGMQLSGVTVGPSTLSALSLLGLISVWYLFRESRGARRWFGVFCAVLLLFVIGAANAYSSLISMLAFAVLYPFCRALDCTSSKRFARRGAETAARMLAMCLLVCCCFFGIQRLETAVVNDISQAVYQHELKEAEKEQTNPPEQPESSEPVQPEPSKPSVPAQPEPSEPSVPEQPAEITISRDIKTSANGVRLSIWKEGIKLFLSHPLGVTNNAISVKVFYGVPDYEYRNLHNGYLTLLVGAGIVGFSLIVIFGVWFFFRTLRCLFQCRDEKKRRMLSVLIASCGAILAADLVNGCFVLWRGLQYIFLWLLLGEICAQISDTSADCNAPE